MTTSEAKRIAGGVGLELFFDAGMESWGLRLPGRLDHDGCQWIGSADLLTHLSPADFENHYLAKALGDADLEE